MNPAYGTSALNRDRWTNARLDDLDELIVDALVEEHPATVRGIFYRVVSAGGVDKSETGYRRVARQVLKLRRAGLIDYAWVTDGTRYVIRPNVWNNVTEAVEDFHASYRRDIWRAQGVRVEVFTEKDAISGVLHPVTDRWGVPLGVVRGYASESFCYEVGQSYRFDPRPVIVYQFGDHDPSGVGAFEDFTKKVRAFAPGKDDIHFQRVAVTPIQIHDMGLPTRPTKRTDTRAAGFIGRSVEVDAIPPSRLRALLETAIQSHVDHSRLAVTLAVEEDERHGLERFAEVARGTL